ncbi:MAG: dCTP deaminase [Candidatus Micrarchaeaceae archaeon]
MILSDYDLENMIRTSRLSIKPFKKDVIRENGIDFRLADEVARHNTKLGVDFVLDPSKEEDVKKEYILEKNKKEIIINSHEQVLMSTIEYLKMPDNVMGFVELRSTWARHGLIMPPTIIDAGFSGNITLEVFNASSNAILLKPGLRFAHIIFATTLNRVSNAYSGSYFGQMGVKLPKVIKITK